MDSKALIDYALFQLTPTRTRCDLVVFSGKKSEKVASGLVEPFIAHLKYAKDQIPKGGYSISLRPPATADYSSWFTKATFQRFVRFVSTPEILERIIRIEREILQIDDSSIQSSEIPIMEETGHPGEESLSVADGNIKKPTNSSKSTSEEEDHGAAPRENSRVRLQRLMDTRKALLQKEQAMAYARAVVAGYEIDTIDDLICFADTFGASRLREACADFKELYKKKHSDDQWMDELAAVQACPVSDLSYMVTSGIMLAGDNIHGNGTLSDSTATTTSSDRTKENNLPAPEQTPNVQQQVQWMNQIPPYMYNFQGPVQQIPSYYPYYPGHMGWSPPGGVVPSKNHKSSQKKEKSFDANGTTDASEEDEQTPSGESDVGTDSDEEKEHDNKKSSSKGKTHTKKNKTKSSKTVVIRNINYITSQRRNGEENEISEDDSSGEDEASIREGVDNAIASLEKHAHSKAHKNRGKQGSHAQNGLNGYAEQDDKNEIDLNISEGGKANNTWDAFQNLLMSHDESASGKLSKHHPGDEHFVMKTSNGGLLRKTSDSIDDSVLMIQRGGANSGKAHTVDFGNGDPSTKKIVFEGESALFADQFKGSKTRTVGATPDFSAEQTTIRNRKEQDWFIVNNSSGNSETRDANKLEFANGSYERGFVQKETTVVDDSFIVESRSAVDEHYVSHWRTDISIDADIDMPKPEKGGPTVSGSVEPDDLCMMLVRESQESSAKWTPEMDYEIEISFSEADKRSSVIESNGHAVKDPVANGKNGSSKKNAGPTTKRIIRDVSRTLSGSLARSKLDSVTKSKKMSPAMVLKSKLMKEEEERKRMEEVRIERQKRIAERTAASGLTSAACKKLPVGNKSTPKKPEKNRSPATVQKLSQANKLTA